MPQKFGSNDTQLATTGGAVTADNGSVLISGDSQTESALLFGPASTREIQSGIANGDFAVMPNDPFATITSDNSLPYWTFTDINSDGAIKCAIVEDSGNASGSALRFSIAESTPTGKSAKITRFIPVVPTAPSGTDARSYSFEWVYKGVTAETNAQMYGYIEYFDNTGTIITTTAPTNAFVSQFPAAGVSAYNYTVGQSQYTLVPVNAATARVTLTVATTGTTAASVKSVDIRTTRLQIWEHSFVLGGMNATDNQLPVWNDKGSLTISGNLSVGQGFIYGQASTIGQYITFGGTNFRLVTAGSTNGTDGCDIAASTNSGRSGILITKSVTGQPTTTVNGTGTTDAFADALRNGGLASDNTNGRFYVYNGSAWKYAALTTPSDSRLKEEITSISDALGKLKQLVPVAFKWKRPEAHQRTDAVSDDGQRLGFIADQVATTDLNHWVEDMGVGEIEHDLVQDTNGRVLAVNIPQNEMEALVVQALLDIDERLKALESR
jgi:hypothetical protein